MSGSVRPFSRLQSTHKPSPSGEGISLEATRDQRPETRDQRPETRDQNMQRAADHPSNRQTGRVRAVDHRLIQRAIAIRMVYEELNGQLRWFRLQPDTTCGSLKPDTTDI